MTYLEGLRRGAIHAINCRAFGSAYTLLDLGLSYGFPEGVPEEGQSLWRARSALSMCLGLIDDPEGYKDPDASWSRLLTKVTNLLNQPIPLIGDDKVVG